MPGDLNNIDSRIIDLLHEEELSLNELAERIQEIVDRVAEESCAEVEAESLELARKLEKVSEELATTKKARDLIARSHEQMTDFVRQNDEFVMSISHSPNPLIRFLGRFAEWPRPFGDEVKRAQYDATIEAQAEMHRQDVKWGAGRQMPNGTGGEAFEQAADAAKGRTDVAFRLGTGTWRHILEEEVWEAFAESNPKKLRVELIQVAAVCLQWVAALMLQKPAKH